MKNRGMTIVDFVLSLLMPALLMVMTLTHNEVYLYAVLGLALLRITKPLVIFPVYFVASLSNEWFGLGTGVSAGRYLSVILLLSLIIDLLSKRKKPSVQKELVVLFVFVLYCLFSCFISVTGSFDAFFIAFLGLMVVILFSLRNNNDVQQLFDVMFCTAIVVTVGMLVVISTIGIAQFTLSRMGEIDDIETNSNRIAMMMAQICAIHGTVFYLEGFKTKGILALISYIVTVFIVILTGSRTGLLASTLPLFIVFLLMHRIKTIRVFLYIIVFGVLFYFLSGIIEDLDLVVVDRLSVNDVVDSGGSDRMPAIKVMWKEVFPQYPILGVGLGGANFNAVARQYGIDHPCHNIFFDSLCQLGIIGFLIFLYIVTHYFKTTYRCIKRTNNELCFLGFFLLLTATINGIGETVYIEKIYWNAIALCVIGIGNATSFSKLIEDGKI